jgi:hypothetical protein
MADSDIIEFVGDHAGLKFLRWIKYPHLAGIGIEESILT